MVFKIFHEARNGFLVFLLGAFMVNLRGDRINLPEYT